MNPLLLSMVVVDVAHSGMVDRLLIFTVNLAAFVLHDSGLKARSFLNYD